MTDQLEVISKYSLVEIIGLIVAITVVISIISQFFKKVYGDLEEWRKRKNHVEDEKEEIEKRVKALENNDVIMNDKLDTISAGVQELASSMNMMSEDLNKRLDIITEENRSETLATARASLYGMWSELEHADHISTAQYETFFSLSSIYRKLGGNSVFANKIIPAVEALPIKD